MFSLEGRHALVTGASGGIGRAIAAGLHAQGAVVALSGTREAALREVAESLGERAHVVPADLSDLSQADGLSAKAEAMMGGLDIVINNAGITRDNISIRMKDAEWDAVLALNLTAGFRIVRSSLKGLDEAPLRADRLDHLGRRPYRQCGPDQLRRRQGGRRAA